MLLKREALARTRDGLTRAHFQYSAARAPNPRNFLFEENRC
jgi:hypothetical protein